MNKLLASTALALVLTSAANAQVAVQQSGSAQNAATAVCTTQGALAVNTVETVTCTPPAGQYVYVTSVAFDVCTDGTGTAVNQVTWTTTNLTGTPAFGFSQAATASICQHWSVPLATPLKSTAAGTAVTFTSPAQAAHNSYHATVVVYYAQ